MAVAAVLCPTRPLEGIWRPIWSKEIRTAVNMRLFSTSGERNRRLGLLILWCGVIFFFSQMPGSGIPVEPPLWYILERKFAHVFEYAVLALLAYRFFVTLYAKESYGRLAFLVLIFALTYGVIDEVHQSFVFGRGARFTDVAIDGLGITLALGLIYMFCVRRKC